MPHAQQPQALSQEMQKCIDACLECHRICLETVNHCLIMGGKHAEASHIKRLLDCAQACQLSADLMTRQSDLHARMCALCADFCDACAADCEAIDPNDTLMKRCAEVCRRCAASCRAMARA